MKATHNILRVLSERITLDENLLKRKLITKVVDQDQGKSGDSDGKFLIFGDENKEKESSKTLKTLKHFYGLQEEMDCKLLS